MIGAVIFDFNGVLVDDEHLHFELFQEVLALEGVALTDRMYHDRYLGFDDRRCFAEVLNDHGRSASDSLLDELIRRKAARYMERAATGLRFFPGAEEAIRSLGAVYPLAICSGALMPEIEAALSTMGVRAAVPVIVPAEETPRCKPDPDGYIMAWERLRDLPDRSLAELRPRLAWSWKTAWPGSRPPGRPVSMRSASRIHTRPTNCEPPAPRRS